MSLNYDGLILFVWMFESPIAQAWPSKIDQEVFNLIDQEVLKLIDCNVFKLYLDCNVTKLGMGQVFSSAHV